MTDAGVSSATPRARATPRSRAESRSSWWVVTSVPWSMTMILPGDGAVGERVEPLQEA
ncbi:hypothetical protein [Streptomyces sp. NPDC088260]|uniref:hypothetical protein n=1 Tax=unclassified Streptomyces TaxID=2593676 RepID=UPI0038297D3B